MTNCKFYKVSDKNDIEVVRLLAERIWHEHYKNILDENQINYMLSTVHSEQAIRDFLSKCGEYYIIDVSGEAVGYFAYISDEKKIFIDKIYVDKNFQRRGIGRSVVEFIKEKAEKRKLKIIALDVNKYNVHSIAAYKSYGFETEKSIVTDIGGGFVMDDFVMYLYL